MNIDWITAFSQGEDSPAGVAGVLIMRFLCPALHFLPSSMYFAVRTERDPATAIRSGII